MLQTVTRFDRADMATRKPETDQWGNLIVEAVVCKPGVYKYRQADGTMRRELKPPEEVFAADHMASVRHAVVTDEHLPGQQPVNPNNARQFTRGHGFEARESHAVLVARMKVTDGELIGEITSGRKTGVSLGLNCTIDHTPGIWNGEAYDVVQRGMFTNQISVTGNPRIADATIRMDSADAVMVDDPPKTGNKPMATMQLTVGDSILEVEPGAGSVIKTRLTALDSEISQLRAEVKSVAAERDTAQAQRDTAVEGLKGKEGLTVDAADIPALFAARRDLMSDAAHLLDEAQLKTADSLSDSEVRKLAVTEAAEKLTNDSDDYIQARFDSLVEIKKSANNGKLAQALASPAPLATPQTGGDSYVARINKGLQAVDSLHKRGVGGMRRQEG